MPPECLDWAIYLFVFRMNMHNGKRDLLQNVLRTAPRLFIQTAVGLRRRWLAYAVVALAHSQFSGQTLKCISVLF